MVQIEKNRIRQYFYLGAVMIIIMLSVCMSVLFMRNLHIEYELKISQLSDSIISAKKRYIKDVIYRIFGDIGVEESIIQAEFTRHGEKMCGILKKTVEGRFGETTGLSPGILGLPAPVNLVVYRQSTNEVLGSSVPDRAALFFETGSPITDTLLKQPICSIKKLTDGDIHVAAFLTQTQVNALVRERVAHRIRKSRLMDGEYIWVNQIINYDGGDNYAIRFIHPNLPDTEGMSLSTDMQDIKGNLPYKEELEGVKSGGEVYFDYYFKKMHQGLITHKLSFAKLYKPFDWVIATGVHLDDVEHLISRESKRMKASYRHQLLFASLAAVAGIVLSIGVMVIFERLIYRLISNYNSDIAQQQKKLVDDKMRLEDALTLLKDVAFKDPLTGLWNRRAMLERLGEETSRCLRQHQCFCLIICDIDYFKNVNDTFGHNGGDALLQSIATLIKGNVRAEDMVSRWGGEEFLILLSHSDTTIAAQKAEHLRELVEKHVIVFDEKEISVTMTFGVANFCDHLSHGETLKSADTALYQGKANGRNRVEKGHGTKINGK
ncbi:MAG: diguanylate cyclase [Desulfobacterium sp.]|nr:diguanylate cyclase [Desulfobacterium sp.]